MNRNVFARTGRVRKLVTGGALATLLLYVGATAVGEVSEEAKRSGRTGSRGRKRSERDHDMLLCYCSTPSV